MGVIKARLIKEYNGSPAGTMWQGLESLYNSLKENGYFADPDPELEALKKKLNPTPDVSDAVDEVPKGKKKK